jgi:hypothetical protein
MLHSERSDHAHRLVRLMDSYMRSQTLISAAVRDSIYNADTIDGRT